MRDDDVQRVCGPDDLIMHETFERDYGFVPDNSHRADNLSEASASGLDRCTSFHQKFKDSEGAKKFKAQCLRNSWNASKKLANYCWLHNL